jgi:hypothetical protein
LKIDHGVLAIWIERQFVIEEKARGHKSRDLGYPLDAGFNSISMVSASLA